MKRWTKGAMLILLTLRPPSLGKRMMHSAKTATLILVAVVGSTAIGFAQQTADLLIRLPQDVRPETVTIAFGGYGDRPYVQLVNTKEGVYEYSIGRNADSLKFLIYCPGYKMIAADYRKDALDARQTFVPSLEKLPTTPLEVRLVNTQRQPVSDQTLHVTYWFTEAMRYFGSMDAAVLRLQIAIIKTNANGATELHVPLLAEDPFFQTYKSEGERFEIFSETMEKVWRADSPLRLGSFPTQRSYVQPLVITKPSLGR